MSTVGQGAPGVRIKLRDASAVNLVSNPNITAGVVGYSPKGELNKILTLTSTAIQDSILGSGYNNPRFNQGLYAARSIINAGGHVEYVRPYGEYIINDKDNVNYSRHQDLKTDTFLVEYDFSDFNNLNSSFSIDYFASTRYIVDGMAGKGYRKIHNIDETLIEQSNIKFEVDSNSQHDASGGNNKVTLFAIMNTDPTAANRAGDRFTISSIRGTSMVVTVTTSSPHGFSVGDEVNITGTSNYNESNVIVIPTELTSNTFQYSTTNTETGEENEGAVFRNVDSERSGVDYLKIKTVATGKATKKYNYLEIMGGSNVILPSNSGDIFTVVDSNNTEYVLEFIDIDTGDNITVPSNIGVDIVHDTFTASNSDSNFTVTYGTKFSVGDSVTLTGLSDESYGITSGTDYLVSSVNSNVIRLVKNDGSSDPIIISTANVIGTIVNQTAILRNIRDGLINIGYAVTSNTKTSFDGSLVTTSLIKLPLSRASNFTVNDSVILSGYEDVTSGTGTLPTGITAGTIYKIATVDLANDTISLKTTTGVSVVMSSNPTGTFTIINLTDAKTSVSLSNGYKNLRLDIVGIFSLTVPSEIQDTMTSFVHIPSNLIGTLITGDMRAFNSPDNTIKSTSDGIVINDSIGRTFLSLGLAIEDYQDINFNGNQNRVFTLTAQGKAVSRLYLFVDYFFSGELYSFSGTITPHVFGDINLDIKEQADNVSNGWKFVVNENISLENAILDSNFDISQSVYNGGVISEFTQLAFNALDPAIVYNAIWEYDPRLNNGSAMIANTWQLFLDKDVARSDMLVAAGTAISNLFTKNLEQINFNVMDAMLSICEKRKDIFAIFDGVDEVKVDTALKKMVGIGSQGDIARWGALFDGRSIFFDSVYTKLNVEVVKSIEVATIITLNRAGNVYWLPPAGDTGRIPASLARRQKYNRSFNFADDETSDIARLYNANINPTRVNNQGQFIYGHKTMLKRYTALNRLNVIMLIAGIHKRFADFLDRKVFQLNTPALRNGITAELQTQLDLIKSSNPAGLTEGICICDNSNNTNDVIDTNQLIVDIFLQPTRTSDFITLRTTVQRTGDTASIVSAKLSGG